MMRGPHHWAVAVRRPEGDIVVESQPLPGWADKRRWLKWPFLRGAHVLAESLYVGVKALMISAMHQIEEEEEGGKENFQKPLGWTLAFALVFFTAIFIVAPAALSKIGGRWIGVESDLAQNAVEGVVRLAFFIGYVLAISLIPDIRRVFQYHGAEHKTIYAYENNDPLVPSAVDRYTTLHVRCGTNFLFILIFLTIAVHFVMDLLLPSSIPIRIAARVLAIPALAGVAYEVIKGASRNERSVIFRAVSLPGLAFQKITTRPPTHDQIEVAIRAMEEVVEKEGLPKPGEAPA